MSEGQSIQLLTDHVINKIAAGEVVERPASVLKELMENALDAGGTQIDVNLVGGGRRVVSVQDNGRGMSRDDALLCVERHATSKIRDVDDIERIGTLGFRGEALAAIASVSRFTLVTRPGDDTSGSELVIHGGTMQSVRDAGAPPGTCVTVRNLFYNVPARRKFLRTEQTEFSHCRQMFLVHALAHPDVGMTLRVDDREVYRLAGGSTLEERVRELFSGELLRSLRKVDYRDIEVAVTGFAGLPQTSRSDRSEQYVFVNGRPSSAPMIGYAVREAYQSSLPKSRHPILFLFIETDPAQVDVNVHPTKKEVRFRRPNEVRDGVIAALEAALRGGDGEGVAPLATEAGEVIDPQPLEPVVTIQDLPQLEPFVYPRAAAKAAATGRLTSGTVADESAPWEAGAPWAWCRILGQVGGLYVVMETDEGLVLMDPQAAHERVLFERYRAEISARKVGSQGLMLPETVEVSPQEGLCIRKHLEVLKALGFGISEFGGDTFMVDALPSCLGNASALSVVGPVARGLEEVGTRAGVARWVEEEIAREACRAAVTSRQTLQLKEIETLVTDLAQAEMPYTCPHGRPTLIFMGFQELDRKFGRR